MLLWHSPHAIQPIDTVQILHLFQRYKLVRTPKSFLRKTSNLLKRPTKGTNKEIILAQHNPQCDFVLIQQYYKEDEKQ